MTWYHMPAVCCPLSHLRKRNDGYVVKNMLSTETQHTNTDLYLHIETVAGQQC